MQLTLYKHAKEVNSTKKPTSSTTQFTLTAVYLKDSCTVSSPVFEIVYSADMGLSKESDLLEYNYLYSVGFGRYYFIDDWEAVNGRWRAHCTIDVLATYKIAIGNSTQYILRSSAASDGRIPDDIYPMKNNAVLRSSQQSIVTPNMFGLVPRISTGYIIVGVISKSDESQGGVAYYQMTYRNFKTLVGVLLGSMSYMGISDYGMFNNAEVLKSIVNPFQYIVSAKWVPWGTPGAGEEGPFPIGWWSIFGVGQAIPNSSITDTHSVEISISHHPQESRGAYLNCAPYTRYSLIWPIFGKIPLESNVLSTANTLKLSVDIDVISGVGHLDIYADDTLIDVKTANLSVPLQLSQITRDYIGAATSAVSASFGAIGSAATGNVGGVISNTVSGIGNAVNSLTPQVTTSGTQGSFGEFQRLPVLYAECYLVADDANSLLGRPLCQDRKVSSLGGFMTVARPKIEIDCTSNELNKIMGYMEGGFYYE